MSVIARANLPLTLMGFPFVGEFGCRLHAVATCWLNVSDPSDGGMTALGENRHLVARPGPSDPMPQVRRGDCTDSDPMPFGRSRITEPSWRPYTVAPTLCRKSVSNLALVVGCLPSTSTPPRWACPGCTVTSTLDWPVRPVTV